MLTQERLKELLRYDPDTGDFTRLVSRSSCKRGDIAGTPHNKGYVKIYIDGVLYYAHRLAWLYITGEWPKGDIDHENIIPSDNRWKNLRPSNKSFNGQNQRRAHSNNKTGFLGVSPRGKGFAANIGANKKVYYLGTYPTPPEAHEEYLKEKRLRHEGCII